MSGSILTALALAYVAHEAAHYATGRAYGYRCAFGWSWWPLGPHTIIGTDMDPGAIVGPRARVIAASGHTANLLLLIVSARCGWTWDALAQLDMLLLASLRDYRRLIFGSVCG